jgi:hypothetical protein
MEYHMKKATRTTSGGMSSFNMRKKVEELEEHDNVYHTCISSHASYISDIIDRADSQQCHLETALLRIAELEARVTALEKEQAEHRSPMDMPLDLLSLEFTP